MGESAGRMQMSGALILFCSFAISSVQSCKQGTKSYYCWWGSIIEPMCPGVNMLLCTQYTFQCACDTGYSRHRNGYCVSTKDCEPSDPPERNIGTTAADNITSNEMKQKENRSKNEHNDKLFEKTVQVVQSYEDLHLLRISAQTWANSLCVCMKSTFMASFKNSADRTIDCYYHPQDPKDSHIMMKRTQTVVVDVVRNGHVKITLRPERGDKLFFTVKNEYEVLAANTNCIVLKTGMNSSGNPYCMLWGVDKKEEHEEDDCLKTLTNVCAGTNILVWAQTPQCAQHDELVKNAIENLNKDV